MPPKPKHWALLFYLVLFWGFAFGLIAMALEVFQPVALVWGRLTLGGIIMAGVLIYKRLSLPKDPVWLLRLLILSVTGNVLPFVLVAWAEQHVASGEVGLLMALMPITTLVMGHYFLTHERFTQQRMMGVFLGLAGVALLLGDDWWVYGGELRLTGQLVTLFATFCYAANGIYAKRLPPIDPVVLAAGSLAVGSILLLGPALWFQDWSQSLEIPSAWLALFVLGTMATGVATWVYFIVVGEVGPGFLSTINYLIPGVAFLVGITVLGETAGWPQYTALLLVLSGVWLIQPRPPKVHAGTIAAVKG